MSAKVNDGLLVFRKDFLLKRPLPIGGWFLGGIGFLDEFTTALTHEGCGWGWEDYHDKEYGGAALVAPLPILLWEKE